MIEIGRLVTKTHGRESGRIAVVVEQVDAKTVIIDGNVKRRKCNIMHLEPHAQKIDIKSGASTDEVKKILEENKLLIKKKIGKYTKRERKGGERPRKVPKKKVKPVKGAKKSKKTEDEIVEAALAKA